MDTNSDGQVKMADKGWSVSSNTLWFDGFGDDLGFYALYEIDANVFA